MKSGFLTSRPIDRRRFISSVAAGALCLAPGHALAQAGGQTVPACVDVRVGSAESYNCLNRELQKQVVQQHQGSTDVLPGATSPAPQVGTFNQAAVAEHLGSNFGTSAIPQRPPPPVFGSPLMGGR